MAAYNKFNQFVRDLVDAKHDFDTHVFKIMLTNTAPVATNQVKADIPEITAGSGYTAGGPTVTITVSISGGTVTVTGANITLTSTGSIGPFRYAVLYNDTTTNKPLVAWWDYGTSITLANTERLSITFTASTGFLQIT